MPLERLVLIVVCVMVAAAGTIWLATLAATAFNLSSLSFAIVPAMLAAYMIWHAVADRLGQSKKDRFDTMDR